MNADENARDMIVNDADEKPSDKHEPGFPCPACHVISIRQPWASLIALGFKDTEFRSRYCKYKGPVVIHSSQNWHSAQLREIVRFHFRKYTTNPDAALQALFPLSRPVAEATVEYCEQWTDDPAIREKFALRLGQVRIITIPKPVFNGDIHVPWNANKRIDKERMRELLSALSRTRVLEGREKDAVYQEFELLALRSKIHTWNKTHGMEFALTSPR
jgi:hypothetical protein